MRVVTNREYLRRRTETFARVTPAQLHDLFNEYEEESTEEISGEMPPKGQAGRL